MHKEVLEMVSYSYQLIVAPMDLYHYIVYEL